jgi:hypothetical protein
LWLTGHAAHERKRGLMVAARRITKFDLRGRSVIGDHTAEQIGRNTADKSCGRAKSRDPNGDVQTGTSNHRHDRIAAVHRLDGQEIDQGISTAQQHRIRIRD